MVIEEGGGGDVMRAFAPWGSCGGRAIMPEHVSQSMVIREETVRERSLRLARSVQFEMAAATEAVESHTNYDNALERIRSAHAFMFLLKQHETGGKDAP